MEDVGSVGIKEGHRWLDVRGLPSEMSDVIAYELCGCECTVCRF